MVRVMATGVFDILHGGHLHYLEEARKLGDELVVVVARDETAMRLKWKPVIPEEQRLEMIRALRVVDKAVLGHVGDRFKTVMELKPDVIALGYDQREDESSLRNLLLERGLDVRVVRLTERSSDLGATRRIIEKILKVYSFQREMSSLERCKEEK